MQHIDFVLCNFLHGELPPPVERVRVWEVPGVDGVGSALLGKSGSPSRLVAVFFGTNFTCEAWLRTLESKIGLVVLVENDRASRAEVLLQRAMKRSVTACYVPNTAITHRAELILDVVAWPTGQITL